jgi:hydrophobic/amphiphilic exporter-1 (mainly G- bacteria), HAE1 family
MSRFFVERPILANVTAIITMVLGLVCLVSLPVAEYPEIVPPTIQVATSYPGASADVVAKTVGIPIEQAVNGVEGSIAMQSTSSSDGSYTLTLTFDVGTNLNTAIALVQNAVNGALSQIPSAVQTQGVSVQKVATNVLLIGSLYSKDDRYDETFLSNYAIINLQGPLARLPGVGQVQVLGAGPTCRTPSRTRTSRSRPGSSARRPCRPIRSSSSRSSRSGGSPTSPSSRTSS